MNIVKPYGTPPINTGGVANQPNVLAESISPWLGKTAANAGGDIQANNSNNVYSALLAGILSGLTNKK